MSLRIIILQLFLPLLWAMSCAPEQAVATVDDRSDETLPLCSSTATFPDLATLAAPELLSGIGTSHLPITTSSAEAQTWFDQGINLLHAFYHLEAYRSFQTVAELDPTCAMAQWGMAMCQPGFGGNDNQRWQQHLERAVHLAQAHTLQAHETELIGALHTTFTQGILAAVPQWEAMIPKYYATQPDVLAFASIMLRQIVRTDEESESVKVMLEAALELHPDHIGLGHYYTHVMEVREDFVDGKVVAERMATLAPNAPHLTHMPGHIYFLEGDYAKTIQTFEGARRQEEGYHARTGIPYNANQNYFHNLHYLAVAYSEMGEKDKALEAAQRYANLSLRQATPLDGNALMILYEGRILPALVHLRFREYDAAAKHLAFWLQHPSLATDHPLVRAYLSTLQTYCKGMAAIEQGDPALAQRHYEQMDQLIHDYERQALTIPQNAEFELVNQVYDQMSLARLQLRGWLDNLDPAQTFDSTAWDEALALEQLLPYDEPPRLMYPVGESLLHLQLWRGDPQAVEAAAKLALAYRPNSPIIQRALSHEINNKL